MTERAYLDWNATAPLRPEARDAMLRALDVVGNPSSVHAEGRAARGMVERARTQVAEAIGCKPQEVVFTSGATEAASVLEDGPAIVAPTAHDALWARATIGARRSGPRTYAMGLADGETGIVSDLPEHRDGVWRIEGRVVERLLVDATQALGRLPFAFGWSDADFAIASSHKLGGPKGVGALVVREGLDIDPLSLGGGQEMGRRSGTENVAAIAGFGAAATAAVRDHADGLWEKVAQLRNILEKAIAGASQETIFVGNDRVRLPNTSCFATPGWKGETQVMQMDLAGFAISAGSACSSGKVRSSRVLKAMGYDDTVAGSAIRVSLGPANTEAEVIRFADAWIRSHEKFRARAA